MPSSDWWFWDFGAGSVFSGGTLLRLRFGSFICAPAKYGFVECSGVGERDNGDLGPRNRADLKEWLELSKGGTICQSGQTVAAISSSDGRAGLSESDAILSWVVLCYTVILFSKKISRSFPKSIRRPQNLCSQRSVSKLRNHLYSVISLYTYPPHKTHRPPALHHESQRRNHGVRDQ